MFESWFAGYRKVDWGGAGSVVRLTPVETLALRAAVERLAQSASDGAVPWFTWQEPGCIQCRKPSLLGDPIGWDLHISSDGTLQLLMPSGAAPLDLISVRAEVSALMRLATRVAA